MEVAGANRRWRCQLRYRGSRRESAVAQLSMLGRLSIAHMKASSFSLLFAVLLAGCSTTDPIDHLSAWLTRPEPGHMETFPNGPWAPIGLPPTAEPSSLA